jgi:zeaxanthin glucosyltransferase
MHHFGMISPPGSSHVTGLTTIGRELCRRGHRATMFNIPDVEELAAKEGVGFCALGAQDHPKGAFRAFSENFGRMRGMKALRFGLKVALDELTMLLDEAPGAMRAAGVTALLVDQGQPAGSTIAARLGVPFITICNAVPANPDPLVPPSIVGWGPPDSWAGELRIRAAHRMFDVAATPLRKRINRYRSAWGLTPLKSLYNTFSPILELSQLTEDFDFPRRSIPPQFHYIGLIRRTASCDIPFPFERLDGRPLVYAAFGTVAINCDGVYRMLAEACAELNAQLVVTLGGLKHEAQYSDLPANPIFVSYAPQFEVLQRASVTVCHGGTNTVLESLASGVPVIAVPLQSDQYGTAARIERSGAGAAIPLKELSTSSVRERIRRLLDDPSYKERAQRIRASIARAGGESRAADLIEQRLGQPGVQAKTGRHREDGHC